MASVQELIAAANAQKSPLVGLLEGLASGAQRELREGPARQQRALQAQLQQQAAQRQQMAAQRQQVLFNQDQEREQRLVEEDRRAKAVMAAQQEDFVQGNLRKVSASGTPPLASQRLKQKVTFNPSTGRHQVVTEPQKPPLERVPLTFEGLVTRQIITGAISEEEGLEKFRNIFPKLQTDELGRKFRLTPDGKRVPFSPVTASSDPGDAILKLRQTVPVLAKRFSTIFDASFPEKNPTLRTSIEGVSASAKVEAILSADPPSQIGLRSLGFYFARMAGSNSQLSDREREVFEEFLEIHGTIINNATKLFTGDFSPKFRADLRILADILSTTSTTQAGKIIASQRKKAKSVLGGHFTKGLADAFPTVESLAVLESDLQSEFLQEVQGDRVGAQAEVVSPVGQQGWTAEDEREFQELQRKVGG